MYGTSCTRVRFGAPAGHSWRTWIARLWCRRGQPKADGNYILHKTGFFQKPALRGGGCPQNQLAPAGCNAMHLSLYFERLRASSFDSKEHRKSKKETQPHSLQRKPIARRAPELWHAALWLPFSTQIAATRESWEDSLKQKWQTAPNHHSFPAGHTES